MKQKLLLIVEAMGGGVRRHVVDLIGGLDESLFEITLFYGGSRADAAFYAQMDILKQKVELVESRFLIREISLAADWRAYLEIRRLIRRLRPDIVHCHSSKAGALGRLAAKSLHVSKIFYTPHAYAFQAGEFSWAKKIAFIWIERWLSRHATTRTFNVSEGEKRCAMAHRVDKPDKFAVIFNGIPNRELPSKQEERIKLGLPAQAFIVGTAARMDKQKNPIDFVRIAEKVISQCPNTHFVCVGDGPLFQTVSRTVRKRGLGEHVHLLGYRQDAEEIISAFDVYLSTSLYEGLPYSLIESLRAGVPIIATKTVGNDEIVVPGENGELFDLADIEEGAQYILSYSVSNGFYNKTIRDNYLHLFSSKKMICLIEKQYVT